MTARDGSPCVVARSLVKTYPGGAAPAVAGVDLDIPAGEIFGLLGPNGAGKSTLVRLLVGLLVPDAGTVAMDGVAVTGRPDLVARRLAYLPQEAPAIAEMPVTTAVETTGRLRGLTRRAARAATAALLAELGLDDVAGRPLTKLSGGQRRLAAVATALVGDRPVLVLDEPTTGLDVAARRSVWQAVRGRQAAGATVLLVTHNVAEAESLLDRVAVVDHGRVIACESPGRLKAMVSDEVRLDVVWRDDPPVGDPAVAMLAARAVVAGRRWTARLPPADARAALERLTAGPAFAALDDFSLATPSLEDVYLALGAAPGDVERS